MSDTTSPGLGVVSLFVARFADLDRAAAVHLDEILCADKFAHFAAIRLVGRDERGECDDARIQKQICQFSDAADVFDAVFG